MRGDEGFVFSCIQEHQVFGHISLTRVACVGPGPDLVRVPRRMLRAAIGGQPRRHFRSDQRHTKGSPPGYLGNSENLCRRVLPLVRG